MEKALKTFGLTPNQIDIYLATLELGEAKAQDIAKKAKILRTTTYEVLEQLKEMGLISQSNRKGVRFYMAEPPKKLDQLLDSKKRSIRDILPELESIYNIGEFKPKIRYYEGLEGLKSVYEDTLSVSNKRLYGILSMEDLFETVGEAYMNDYVERRIKTGVHLQVIRSKSKEVRPIWHGVPQEFRSLRYAPEGSIFPLTMYIYDNKVTLLSSKRENFGLIIESKEYMQTQKALFDVLWSVSTVPK